MDPNRQSDPYDTAPKRSMDGVRRTGGSSAPLQPLSPMPPPRVRPQPLAEAAPRQVARHQPTPITPKPPKPPKQKSDRHVVRGIAQAFLAIAVILAVAAAIVWLYLRYYQ